MSNETKVITAPSDELMLKPEEKSNESGVITELENNKIIKEYGSLDIYLSMQLLKVIETAVAPDNKGQLHIDYRTRLRSVEAILKLKDKNFGGGGVSVNFFASPKHLKH